MRTKKIVIAVLAAVLVISAAWIVGCIEPQEAISFKPVIEDNYQITEGKGIVRFKITDDKSRTILPALVTVNNMEYDIQFVKGMTTLHYPTSDDGTTPDGTLAFGDINTTPLELDVGTYTVTVTGWYGATPVPVAGWTGSVNITTGTTPVNAPLKGIVTGTNKGKFKYDITLPAGVSYQFTAATYPNGSPSDIATLTVGGQSTGGANGIDMNPGYYIVKLLVSQQYYQTISFVYVLHIYPEMTSTMPTVSGLTLVKNTFDVSFDFNKYTGTDTPTGSGYNLATQHVLYGLYASDPGTPLSTEGHTFLRWNTLANGSGTNWVPANFGSTTGNRILDDVALFAIWQPAGSKGDSTYTIAFSVTDFGTNKISSDVTTISRNFASNETITLTLAAPVSDLDPAVDEGGGTWNNIKWHVGGNEYTGLPHVVNGELIIDKSGEFNGLLAGSGNITRDITVTADLTGNTNSALNVPYSGTITITVN